MAATELKQRSNRRLFGRYSGWDVSFNIVNYTLLILFTFICVFPFINTVANAFSSSHAIQTGKVVLWPVDFQLDAITKVVTDANIIRSLWITVYITVVGTALNMLFTITTAYPLSRKDLKGRKYFMNFMIITMVFSGGLIPGYLLIKSLGLLNSLWSLMIPGLISAFLVIIMKSFFSKYSRRTAGCRRYGRLRQYTLSGADRASPLGRRPGDGKLVLCSRSLELLFQRGFVYRRFHSLHAAG